MAISNITELRASIISHLDRDDLSTVVNDLIALAESVHKREIRIREMLDRATGTIAIATRYVALPTGFLGMKTFRLLTEPRPPVLEEVNQDTMNRVRREVQWTPRFFTVQNEIELDVEAIESFTGEMIYYKALTPLSDQDTTNALLARSPDAYLYGALMASAPFLSHDPRIELWGALYAQARDGLNAMDRRLAGPLVSRVTGSTP